METKKCPKCKKLLIRKNDFYYNSARKDKTSAYCKICHVKDGLERNKLSKNQARLKYSSIKSGCNRRKVNIYISKCDFINWYNSSEKKCVYCNITEDLLKKINWHALVYSGSRTLSVDRIDNSKDYLIENICLACSLCNYMKGTLLSFEEMKEIGPKYVKPKWEARL